MMIAYNVHIIEKGEVTYYSEIQLRPIRQRRANERRYSAVYAKTARVRISCHFIRCFKKIP